MLEGSEEADDRKLHEWTSFWRWMA